MQTRKAKLPDVEAIFKLIARFSPDGTLLPRTRAELSENIRDFVVLENKGKVVGCGALHLYGMHLTEIRSICVHPSVKGKGGGGLLIEALMAEAKEHNVRCVCLFTRIPEFFAHYGFKVAQREELPDKIYKDCVKCPRLHACDEVAMVRGELPKISILPPPTHIDVPVKMLAMKH